MAEALSWTRLFGIPPKSLLTSPSLEIRSSPAPLFFLLTSMVDFTRLYTEDQPQLVFILLRRTCASFTPIFCLCRGRHGCRSLQKTWLKWCSRTIKAIGTLNWSHSQWRAGQRLYESEWPWTASVQETNKTIVTFVSLNCSHSLL